MKKADKKVKEYLERADKLLEIIDGEIRGSLSDGTMDPMMLIIEVAKMLQREELNGR